MQTYLNKSWQGSHKAKILASNLSQMLPVMVNAISQRAVSMLQRVKEEG